MYTAFNCAYKQVDITGAVASYGGEMYTVFSICNPHIVFLGDNIEGMEAEHIVAVMSSTAGDGKVRADNSTSTWFLTD